MNRRFSQRIRLAGTFLALSFVAVTSFADNLDQVFQQAVLNDPTFRKAQATWMTEKMTLPLAVTGSGAAGTGLLPNVAFSGQLAKIHQKEYSRFGPNSGNFPNNLLTVSVTQPIFNLSTWAAISSASYTVKAATAVYLAAVQDLINRVSFAYFEVLRADSKLGLTLQQEKQFLHQLETSQQKFKVGLIAITGVYDAQASYDKSIADEIKDRNDLQDRLEDLRAITGKHYKSLFGLKSEIPLVVPKPNNINVWAAIAARQSYIIQADINNMYASKQNVKTAALAAMPSVNATGSYSYGKSATLFNPPFQGRTPNTNTTMTEVGIEVNFPVFRGGYDVVNTRQARYQYLAASDQLALDHRTVDSRTRQAFLGIESGISQIQADQQSIISSRNQLEATQAGYIVGTRTMVDVLDSVTSLTQAQLAYADDRYDYVEGIFSLKQQAGTLSPNDIAKINTWLGKRVHFSLIQPSGLPKRPDYYKTEQIKGDLLEINRPELTDPVEIAKAEAKKKQPLTPVEENILGRTDAHMRELVSSPEVATPSSSYQSPELSPVLPSRVAPGHQNSKSSALPSRREPAGFTVPTPGSVLPYGNKMSYHAPASKSAVTGSEPQASSSGAVPDGTIKSGHQSTQVFYTINLVAARSQKLAEQYYYAHNKNKNIRLIRTQSEGQIWYQVIYGRYSSEAQAKRVLRSLPAVLKQYAPWVSTYPQSQ